MTRLFLLAAAIAFAAAAFAQQYKWVDKDGKVRYGDVPPPGVKATPLKAPPPAPVPPGAKSGAKDGKAAPAKPLSAAEKDAEFRKRQQEAEKTRVKEGEAAQDKADRTDNCARLQEELRMYESGQRVPRTDAKGERYFLDENQIAQEAVRVRRIISQVCK